ncbi:MAG: hypothetical protein ACKVQK_00880 [Burkholderiales bacterium]
MRNNDDYDGFRGPDPTWLTDDIKRHMEWLRGQVSLAIQVGTYRSPDHAESLYLRRFNNDEEQIKPIEMFYATNDVPAVIELANLCLQIVGKGIRRSELLKAEFGDWRLRIELARDKRISQAMIAKKPRLNSLAHRLRTLNVQSYAEALTKCPQIVDELGSEFGSENAKKKLSQAISKNKKKEKLP